MMGRSELRLNCVAEPSAARPMRHAVASFLAATGIEAGRVDDILTAVGEALANAVEHAYDPAQRSDVELCVQFQPDGSVTADVFDRGCFVQRDGSPGRGYGLRIVRAIAREVHIDTHNGTRIHMLFEGRSAPSGSPTPLRAS